MTYILLGVLVMAGMGVLIYMPAWLIYVLWRWGGRDEF